MSAIYGQSALLFLEYEGNPSPSLTWYHDGQELPVNITGTAGNKAGYVNLTNIDFGDYGNYTAVLNNSVGSYQAVYTVIPKGIVKIGNRGTTRGVGWLKYPREV